MASLATAVLILGALGLFLALPGRRAIVGWLGMILLAGAGALLIATLVQFVPGQAESGWFIVCTLVALFAALRVITHSKPVYSALYFVLLVVAVTGLVLLMQAEFLALALIIVYAGAIVVTYVFVIMLAQQARRAPYDTRAREPFWGCLAGFTLLTMIAARFELFTTARTALPEAAEQAGTVVTIGIPLLTHYVIAIQIIGLLLLAALVGAIAIGRRQGTVSEEGGTTEC